MEVADWARKGSTMRIYMDGSLASGGSTLAVVDSTRDMHIGDFHASYNDGPYGFFSFTI